MFDVDKIREDFPILHREVNGKPLIYLDTGATAQKPRSVIEKTTWLNTELNSNIHRGIHYLSSMMTQEYEQAREIVRKFVNARSTSEIVFTSGATEAVNLVAYSFGNRFVGRGDNIIVSEMEHHSNIVPWQLLCQRSGAHMRIIPFDDNGRLMIEELDRLIDDRSRIIAVTQASNVLGSQPDIKAVVNKAHLKNVPVLVDGCQGIVHGSADVADLDCDFYVFSGHKLYGPTGTGVLYGKESWLEQMPPFLGGGDMVDKVSFEETTYAELPLKFEAGTANFIGAIGLAEAIKYLLRIGIDNIRCHENALLDYATERLSSIEGLRIYGNEPEKCAIVSFNVTNIHPSDIGLILDKLGIAIRTGTHCAQPIMRHYGIDGMCRASFGLYNTCAEIDRLHDGIVRAAAMLA